MLEVKNLSIKYFDYYSLFNINFKLEIGDKAVIYGEDAIYLFRILCKLDKNYEGSVKIFGKDLNELDYERDINVGLVTRQPVLFKNKTVKKNLKYVLKIRKTDKKIIDEKVESTLKNFDLIEYKDVKVKKLDHFSLYKLCLARLSIRQLDLLLIEDIFQNVESDIFKYIAKLNFKILLVNTSKTQKLNVFNRKITIENGIITQNL